VGRRKHTFEDSAVESDLKFWGYYYGRLLAADGYSSENTIKRLLLGLGGIGGHRILVRDMKPRAWDIHGRVMTLPEHLRGVLIARYCLPPEEKGGVVRYYLQTELAGFLGVTRNEYQRRLRFARLRYKALIFSCREIYACVI
jgi:hypothetical protein